MFNNLQQHENISAKILILVFEVCELKCLLKIGVLVVKFDCSVVYVFI